MLIDKLRESLVNAQIVGSERADLCRPTLRKAVVEAVVNYVAEGKKLKTRDIHLTLLSLMDEGRFPYDGTLVYTSTQCNRDLYCHPRIKVRKTQDSRPVYVFSQA